MGEIEKLMQSVGCSSDYRIINCGGKSLYIEGIKSVICFGNCEMMFQLKKQCLQVVGNSLKIKYLDKSTCLLEGIINSVVVK